MQTDQLAPGRHPRFQLIDIFFIQGAVVAAIREELDKGIVFVDRTIVSIVIIESDQALLFVISVQYKIVKIGCRHEG
ncbi:hypothetical protein D3C75_1325480 [compost metagenome]